MGSDTVDTAAEAFENVFKSILEKHAPMKVYQMRKNYSPYVSDETKDMITNRKVIQEEATRTGCKVLL